MTRRIALCVLILAAQNLAAMTTGVITSRPPAPHDGRPINFVQGAAPVSLGGATILLFTTAGACCFAPGDGAWEGIYVYHQRQWYPLWAADDWGANSRDEHEVTYASPVVWDHPRGPLWFAAYAATRASTIGQSRRVHIGFAATRLHPLQRWPIRAAEWIRPAGPDVWGIFPIALLAGGNNTLTLWAWDHSARAVIMYIVDADARAWPRRIATFAGVGPTDVPPALTDIARGADGWLYALEGLSHTTDVVREWVSRPAWGVPTGQHWELSGRTWSHPGGTTFDCGYTRDVHGALIEPRLVVCNWSPQGVYADTGAWVLRWFADPGAIIPPDWVERPPARTIRRGGQ